MIHVRLPAAAFAAIVFASSAATAQTADATIQRIVGSGAFKNAVAFLEKDHDRFVREIITLTEIPAPPFKEKARAEALLTMFRQHKLADVEMDPEGNVLGVWKGTGSGPLLAIAVHIDTVFPEGTNVKVKREGNRLLAPGAGDNTRGIALVLTLLRAMAASGIRTASDILFVGDVGEEGEGDLRGVKYLLQKGKYKDRIKLFIAIDGDNPAEVLNAGVGSRRYRVTFKGPGGHSYSAFGLVNPAYAMAGAIARFAKLQVPEKPKTTYSIGAVRGGTSVNSIPHEVSMDVDMRSESCAELKKLDAQFLAVVREAVEEENKSRRTKEGPIVADPRLIGDRPCGETSRAHPLVQQATAAMRAFGITPGYRTGSTDANLPMSLGIPAITVARGPGGRAHSLDEWTDIDPKVSLEAAKIALATILAAAGYVP